MYFGFWDGNGEPRSDVRVVQFVVELWEFLDAFVVTKFEG